MGRECVGPGLLPGVAGQPRRRRDAGGPGNERHRARRGGCPCHRGPARKPYEFQDFNFTGSYGDNGFLEDYTSQVQGEPLSVIVTVTRNAAGKAQHIVVNHRPRNTLLLFSCLMHEKFAGTSLAGHFLADES